MKRILIFVLFFLFDFSAAQAQTTCPDNYVVVSVSGATTCGPNAVNGMTSFSSPNLQMPNGGFLAHMIYTATSGSTISGTSDASCFGATGIGSQSPTAAAFYAGAKFRIQCSGTYNTGALSIATLTIKVKFGATAIATFTSVALPVSITGPSWYIDVTCTVRTGGVSGSVVCSRIFGFATAAGGLIGDYPLISTSPVSVDLSGTTTKIDVTGAFSSLTGSPSATTVESSIEQVD